MHLPVELLQKIFMSGSRPSYPSYEQEDVTYAPLLVCSYWREAALSLSSWWDEVVLSDFHVTSMRPAYFKHWLSLSKQAPLKVFIHFRDEYGEGSRMDPLLSMLFSQVFRWASFTVIAWHSAVSPVLSMLDQAELLTSLSVELLGASDDDTLPFHLVRRFEDDGLCPPKLSNINCTSVPLHLLPQLGGLQTASLALKSITLSSHGLRTLITDMPNLESLVLASIEAEGIVDINEPNFPALPSLEYLSADMTTMSGFGDGVQSLIQNAPRLTTLSITLSAEVLPSWAGASSLTLKALHLTVSSDNEFDFHFTESSAREILARFPSVEHLLLAWEPENSERSLSFSPILRALSKPRSQGSFLCPSLNLLTLQEACVHYRDVRQLLAVRSALKGGQRGPQFQLEMTKCFGMVDGKWAMPEELELARKTTTHVNLPYYCWN
jgi:hypothetical protein